jgi:Ni/Fe-hydrogenase subunit HybB-like protein
MATSIRLEHQVWQPPVPPMSVTIVGILGSLTFVGVAAGIARLFAGLGPTTSLSNAVPWGIWIGFDFALIALSGAGFTMAALAHVLHQHRFDPVVRPALYAGFLGYVAVLLLLVLDLGRPDRFYHFILYWNFHSPLFEISWCVLLYTTVLVLEVAPDILGFLRWSRLQRLVRHVMPVVCIVGVTLSTLHQSTLGTLYVNMPHRLHPLWYSPFLPVLFFVSAVMAGLSVANVAYRLATRARGTTEDRALVVSLNKIVAATLCLFLILRVGQLAVEGRLDLLAIPAAITLTWWLEFTVMVLAPLALFITAFVRRRQLDSWLLPLLVIGGVTLNRFNSTMAAQISPLGSVDYVPHLLEWFSTVGILAGAALVWYLAVRWLTPATGQDHH